MPHPFTIAVDLDSTIADNTKWVDRQTFGLPVHGVKDFLNRLRTVGAYIIVYTARIGGVTEQDGLSIDQMAGLVMQYMNKFNLPFDEVWVKEGKPKADVYLDDRAINFNGSYDGLFEKVLTFSPWQKADYSGPIVADK